MRHLALVGLVVVLLLAGPARSYACSAGNMCYGYVCYVAYVPPVGSEAVFGNYGIIELTITSAPNCGGSVVWGPIGICSAGHTDPSCDCNATPMLVPQTDVEMMAVYQTLVTAAGANSSASSLYSVGMYNTGCGIGELEIRPY